MESTMIISLVLSIVAILLWIVTMPLVFMAWIELKTFMKSTHNIEWVPAPAAPLNIDEHVAKQTREPVLDNGEISDLEKTFREMEELEQGIEIKNYP